MKKTKDWLLITATALFFLYVAHAALPFKKVSLASKTTTTTTTTTTTEANVGEDAEETVEEVATPKEQSTAENESHKSDNATVTGKNSKLTGIPQIDYIWDPNLPRELRGYNLSSYPFLATVPEQDDIHFKCDGLHDGFYASIEHKCQVYHHCVYSIRHDFLCANFTAFDQRTFICHFVSDVDCEGSQRYWNRNDELYMATTTTSTTTTTTEPPPTPRRRPQARPQRPLRRPYNRRPIDDYYYDEEEEDDDYYVERYNRRRKQRPKQRKPIVDYDDEYDEKRSFDNDDDVHNNDRPRRNRFRDEEEQDEDYSDNDRRSTRQKGRQNKPTDRRKNVSRKPGRADERRSFNDERPIGGRKDKLRPSVPIDESVESVVESNPRRLAGRRRINEKRITQSTAAALDDLDDYERPHAADQEEAAEEEAPQKVKTTPKPLEEFITPKAAPSSVYSRPRAPPRIARPVPITEKKKYQYPVQKATATTQPPASAAEDDDYYQLQENDYEDVHARSPARRRTAAAADDDESAIFVKRRNHNDAVVNNSRKTTRTTLRKPVTDKKALLEDDEYDDIHERIETSRGTTRRRPFISRARPSSRVNDDVDFVDDDYDEKPSPLAKSTPRARIKPTARKNVARPRQPIVEEHIDEDDISLETERPQRVRLNSVAKQPRRNKPVIQTRARPTAKSTPAPAPSIEDDDELEHAAEPVIDEDVVATVAPSKSQSSRTASVRVVKRPFLPSRGGSPYLPRGLQPVGLAIKPLNDIRTTDSTPIDMGSTISGVRLLEHGAPILRNEGNDDNDHGAHVDDDDDDDDEEVETNDDVIEPQHDRKVGAAPVIALVQAPRTTLPPRSAIPVSTHVRPEPQPKVNLDELYENDYDVTLNDALDPTLKPLTPQHQHQHYNRNYASAYSSPAAVLPSNINAPAAAVLNPFVHSNQSPAQQHYQQQQHQQQSATQQQSQAYQPPNHHYQSPSSAATSSHTSPQLNYNSDSYFSSTDIRRRAIVPAQIPRSSRTEYIRGGIGARIAQHFYDDFEY